MKISVSYSFAHEVGNYFNSVYRFRWARHGNETLDQKLQAGLSRDFVKSLSNCKDDPLAKQVIKEYLLKTDNQHNYLEISRKLEETWKANGKQIEKKLGRIYGKPFPFKTMNVYLTSIPINPYHYPDWIMVYAFMPVEKQLRVLGHELNHFMFYYYFRDMEAQLGKEKFESLKEALTVLSEPEREGYPAQREMRMWLRKQEGTVEEILKKPGWKTFL